MNTKEVIIKALEHAQRDSLTIDQTADKILSFLEIADILGRGSAAPYPADGGVVSGHPASPSALSLLQSAQSGQTKPEREKIVILAPDDEPEMELPTIDAVMDPNQPKRSFSKLFEYVNKNAPKSIEVEVQGNKVKIPLTVDSDAMSGMVRLTTMFGHNAGPHAVFNVYEDSIDLERKISDIKDQVMAQLNVAKEVGPLASNFQHRDLSHESNYVTVYVDDDKVSAGNQFPRDEAYYQKLQQFVKDYGPIDDRGA